MLLPMVAVITLAHELGHAAAALALGCEPVVHFASCGYGRCTLSTGEALVAAAAGPVQTLAMGTCGLAWLWRLRRRVAPEAPLGVRGWAATLLALAFVRNATQPVQPSMPFSNPRLGLVPDEVELARGLGLPDHAIAWPLAAVSFAACVLVVVRLHPRGERSRFLLVGLASGFSGFLAWYGWLGPMVLP
jgi:hypothetical protein